MTIDTASPSGKVSPLFYGLMTEEINHAYDGGLYAELVRNRVFLDDAATAGHWSLAQADGSVGAQWQCVSWISKRDETNISRPNRRP